MRVLLLDDNVTFLQAAREYLTGRDADGHVDILSDPTQALWAVEHGDYDVIATDLRMPGLNGMEFLGACRNLRPDTPVILVSGYGDVDLADQAAQCGAYAFLHKPVDPDAFYSVVKRAALRSSIRRRSETYRENPFVWPPNERIRERLEQLNERLRRTLNAEQDSE